MGVRKGNEEDKAAGESINSTRRRGEQCRTEQVAAATSIAAFTGFIAAVSERNSPHSFCILSSTVAQPLLQVAGYPLEQSSDGSSQHSAFTRPMALLNSTKLAQEPTTTGALPSSSSVCRSMAVPLMATTSSQCHPRAPARAHS